MEKTIPIGQIRPIDAAQERLWGRSVIAALVAETLAGQMPRLEFRLE